MKNYGDLGRCYPPRLSLISIILWKILSLIHYLLINKRDRLLNIQLDQSKSKLMINYVR